MKKLGTLSVVSALLAASCVAAEKSSNPLNPSVAGPIPGVNITPPRPVEPRDGVRIAVDRQPVTLLLDNAATNGVRPLSYVFEVATDTGFTNKVFTREGVKPGEGRTALRLPDPLASGRTYYWRAQAVDGANSSVVSALAFFIIFTPIVIERPRLDSPINNVKLDDFVPEFNLTNAQRSGPVGAVNYVLELSDTDSFANKVAVWTFREQPERTSFDAPHPLVGDKQFFWRVHAFETNTNASGPWSDVQVFRTASAVVVPNPGPGGGAACGPPYPNQPFGIVQCRRSQYGHMSSGEILSFLRGVAKDINAAGISGGPYGILRKQSGSNCGGYSCDIICSGSGTSQKQYDVLLDAEGAQTALWGSPKTYPGIRVDICEVQ
jgi:hypothetical protein